MGCLLVSTISITLPIRRGQESGSRGYLILKEKSKR
jgi:hypothetical protein